MLPGLPQRATHDYKRHGTSSLYAALTWNDDPKPYGWTKIADQILDSIATYCTRINESRH